MTVIDRITEKLAKYPEVKFRREESFLSIPPQTSDGFEVAIRRLPTESIVSFGGWHEHFEKEEDALEWFGFGLSEECRLKIISRAGMHCRWIVEGLEGDEWIFRAETGSLFQPFFLPKKERVQQNHLIKKKANQISQPTPGGVADR
jgi:hypothetical protein